MEWRSLKCVAKLISYDPGSVEKNAQYSLSCVSEALKSLHVLCSRGQLGHTDPVHVYLFVLGVCVFVVIFK